LRYPHDGVLVVESNDGTIGQGSGFAVAVRPAPCDRLRKIDIGADVRYTAWRHFFVRPEAHFYRIFNNNEFHSGNVLRLGVSVGYTFSSQ